MQINGDIQNIKQHIVKRLEGLYEKTVPIGQLSTHELNSEMLEVTHLLGREVAIYLNRQGKVLQVSVGDTDTVDLPEFKSRRAEGKLTGIRCIHTHPSGDTRLSEPDLSSLRRLRFDCMAAIGFRADREGEIVGSIGFFTGDVAEDGTEALSTVGPLPERALHTINLTYLITVVNKKLSARSTKTTADETERALLAGLDCGKALWPIDESMAELERLADTAGAVIVGKFIQRREKPDAAFFLGRGKVAEIAMEVQNRDATLLILDVFAQRARTKEGKLQVELAQLQYNLPRLGGQGLVLSRLGGGIGTRGPGETKLEVDRRRIYARIHDLEAQIDAVQKNRHLHRRRRKLSRLPLVALVGYTNAGKSTLLNRLTGSEVFAEDKLFATLDPTTRHLVLPEKQEILLTDTVGFIQKLPHTLVKAFRATLEEVQEADLLLHVVDCSNENYEQQIESVVEVLKELDAVDKPTLYVFNKADRFEVPDAAPGQAGKGLTPAQEAMMLHGREGICVSARTGANLLELQQLIEHFFMEQQVQMELLIPFAQGRLLTELHELHAVRGTDYCETGTRVKVSLPASKRARFEPYEIHKK